MPLVLLVQGLAGLDVQEGLRHDVRAGRHHHAVADVEHGRWHDRRGAEKRLYHREAEAADVEAGTVEHGERAILHRRVTCGEEDEHGRDERDHEAEDGDPQHAGIMRVRGERVDDGAGQNQVEQGDLHDAVVAVFEFAGAFEQVAGEDDGQQRDWLN